MKQLVAAAILLSAIPVSAHAYGYYQVINNIGELSIVGSYQQKFCVYDYNSTKEIRIRWAKYGVCPYSIKYNDTTGEWKEMSEY